MAQDESDEIVILDWVIDYYCYKFWEEFEKDQRAEMLSDDKFISFVDCLLSFAGSKIDQKSERAIFLELLRQLWEAGNVEEMPSPLEVAIGHLEELIDQYHKNAVTLDVDWDSLRLAFKKHAVLLLVREGYVSRARGLTDKLWPRKKRKDADKELLKSLLEGQNTEEAGEENTVEQFYQEIIPVLRQVHDSFGMPFLAKIMKTKRRAEAQRVAAKKVFSLGALRQVCGREWRDVMKLADKLAKTSAPNGESGDNRAQRREQNHSATGDTSETSDAASPQKRGKSIRDVHYTKRRRPATASGGEAATWTSSDEEEDDRPSIYRQKLNTPRKRRSLLRDSSPAAHPLRRPWSEEEVEYLKEGVARFGVGRWADILVAFDFDRRTNIHLKDKWRNLVKNGLV